MKFERKSEPKLEDIKEIEKLWKNSLSDDFIQFYMKYSGYELPYYEYTVDVLYQSEGAPDIDAEEDLFCFSNLEDIKRLWKYTGPSHIQHYLDHFEHPKSIVDPEALVAFAEGDSGVFYISTKGRTKDKILYADNGDFGIGLVADNLESFMKKLNID